MNTGPEDDLGEAGRRLVPSYSAEVAEHPAGDGAEGEVIHAQALFLRHISDAAHVSVMVLPPCDSI